MEIKAFKEGVAQLAAYTNQRVAAPEPFFVQYGKDKKVHLGAADESGTIVWMIDGWNHSPIRGRYGIPSKVLYQASKVLKGKGEVDFEYGENDLIVHVVGGGKITLPYGDMPDISHRPDKEYVPWIDQIDLLQMQQSLKAVLPTREDYVVATPVAPGQSVTTRLTASNGYTVWETMTMPQEVTSEAVSFRMSGLLKLKKPAKNSYWALGTKSVRVNVGEDYTLYTSLLADSEFIHYPSLKLHHYPEGKRARVVAEVDKNTLLGAVKAVAPDTKDQQFRMTKQDNVLTLSGIQHHGKVDVPVKSGWGNGAISLGAIYTIPVLQAFENSSILVVYDNPRQPVGFREKNKPYESFLVAPVFKE